MNDLSNGFGLQNSIYDLTPDYSSKDFFSYKFLIDYKGNDKDTIIGNIEDIIKGGQIRYIYNTLIKFPNYSEELINALYELLTTDIDTIISNDLEYHFLSLINEEWFTPEQRKQVLKSFVLRIQMNGISIEDKIRYLGKIEENKNLKKLIDSNGFFKNIITVFKKTLDLTT